MMRDLFITVGLLAGVAFGQDFIDTPAAVLLTSARISDFGRGKVEAYFPAAVLSRDPIRRTVGYFLFDATPARFERSQVPLKIRFTRGSARFDDQKQEWVSDTADAYEYSADREAFLAKLRELVAEAGGSVPEGMVPAEPVTGLGAFSPSAPRALYLLSGEWKAAAGGGAEQFHARSGDVSFLLEIGDRAATEAAHKAVRDPDVESQLRLYRRHFRAVAVEIRIFRLRPGQTPVAPRRVQGVYLFRHKHPSASLARLAVPGIGATAWTAILDRLEISASETSLALEAAPFLQSVVAAAVAEPGQRPAALRCVPPDDGPAPCRGADASGKQIIDGKIRADSPLVIFAERAGDGAPAPGSYRELYRIEWHLLPGEEGP